MSIMSEEPVHASASSAAEHIAKTGSLGQTLGIQ